MPYKCTACEKSFRYKVSQRTHKCTAQPPGTVVRQTGDLLQKLLHSAAIFSHTSDEDPISKSLDQLVNESCDKMGIENGASMNVNISTETNDIPIITMENNLPSPSARMKNLSLISMSLESEFESKMETRNISDESLRQLL